MNYLKRDKCRLNSYGIVDHNSDIDARVCDIYYYLMWAGFGIGAIGCWVAVGKLS